VNSGDGAYGVNPNYYVRERLSDNGASGKLCSRSARVFTIFAAVSLSLLTGSRVLRRYDPSHVER
jgi:hypothetical protein